MRSVGDRGEAADDRVACDVHNDGRGALGLGNGFSGPMQLPALGHLG
jgi:hypothetical protein